MSSKNKKNSQKQAAPPKNQNPPPQQQPPTLSLAPPSHKDPPLTQFELGTYFTTVKPESWSIVLSPVTGKFELLARDKFGTDHRVIAAPTLGIARDVARFCQDILSNAVARPEGSEECSLVDLISRYWDHYFKKCADARIDPVEMEQLQRETRHAKELVASLRSEPLIRFGLAACARKDIKQFVMRQAGATWALFLIDKEGASHFCKTGGPDSEEELSKEMDAYIKKANQQFIDPELRAQCSLASVASKTVEAATGIPQEQMETASPAPGLVAAVSSAVADFEELVAKKRNRALDDDDDDDNDVDDKNQPLGDEDNDEMEMITPKKKEEPKMSTNGPRFDLTVRKNTDADASVTNDKEKTEFVRAVDPATLKKENGSDEAPHDGKMNNEKLIPISNGQFLRVTDGPPLLQKDKDFTLTPIGITCYCVAERQTGGEEINK